jgi:hypothetical protein
MRARAQQIYGRVHMLGSAGSIQVVVDGSRMGQLGSWMPRLARLMALLVCVAVALSIVGVAPAAAEVEIRYKPQGIHEKEVIANNIEGKIESEPVYTEPPGFYAITSGIGGGGGGEYEYAEECLCLRAT